MQNVSLGEMNKLIIHFVGNKNKGDGVRFSNTLIDFNNLEEHFKRLVDSNFKFDELYQFYFLPDLNLNPMYNFVSSVFQERENFIEQSKNAGRFLYDKSTHPNIKAGELCLFFFENCQINDELVDCIGIFKSENKDTILKVNVTKDGFDLKDEKGMSATKLDKGCLIFNTKKETGYLISFVDNTNKGTEAHYWKNDFLGIEPIKNDFHKTNQFLGITKNFVTNQLSNDFEVSKAEQIDLLNRSVDYFKTRETFDKQEFEEEVFADSNIIDSFRKFDQTYREENEVDLSDNFEISAQAVKKQARVFKSVLKLDKNFHIYIHGDKELIEQGIDENGRKFYKIYYNEES